MSELKLAIQERRNTFLAPHTFYCSAFFLLNGFLSLLTLKLMSLPIFFFKVVTFPIIFTMHPTTNCHKNHNMKNITTVVLLSLFLLGLAAPIIGQTTTVQLSQKLTETFQSSNMPGMAVAIVNKDKILYKNQFGYADVAAKIPYTHNTLHNIGSTSKTFIGMAIMQLVEQGKLTLDTKVNDVLPFKVVNPYHPAVAITVRQLATHTSSIRDRTFNYDLKAYVSDDNTKGNRKGLPLMYKIQFKRMLKNKDISLEEFLENTLSKKGKSYKKKNYYKNAPGTTEHYSNIGAALAGYIVEVITGEKYADYVVNHILKPLKMEATGWTAATTNQAQFAKRYVNGVPFPDYHLTTYPDGGLISSTADLSKYLMAMIRGYKSDSQLLSAASFQQMMSNQYEQVPLVKTLKETAGRSGVFWDIFAKKGTGDIGHNGSDPGILSFMYFNPESGIGCLLFTNTDAEDKNIKEVVKMWEILIKYRNDVLAQKTK